MTASSDPPTGSSTLHEGTRPGRQLSKGSSTHRPLSYSIKVKTEIPLTVTPASAASASTRNSPLPHSSHLPLDSSPTPNSLVPEFLSSSGLSPTPSFSDSPMYSLYTPSPTSPPSSMSQALAGSSRTGLIRRLSQGATNKLTRYRPSKSNKNLRDQSAGPVIMRRRSDSRTTSDPQHDVSDLELDAKEDESIEDCTSSLSPNAKPRGLGISSCSIRRQDSDIGPGVGPTRPQILQHGTVLTKVTRKKCKDLRFHINYDAAKVYWDPTKSSKQFYIDDIRDIRTGADARNYRQDFGVSAEVESRWFTILYSDPSQSKGRMLKTMHLIAHSDHVFKLWTETLDGIANSRAEVMEGLAGSGEKSIKFLWRQEMTRKLGPDHAEGEGYMDLNDAYRVCRSLHIHCTENTLRAKFDKADEGSTGFLHFQQFKHFVKGLREREDIKQIFKKIDPNSAEELDQLHFLEFLRGTQGVDVDSQPSHWKSVFEKHARPNKSKLSSTESRSDTMPTTMDLAGFQSFLCSDDNSALAHAGPTHPLDRPLNEYFISSSHNTYLLGRQVAGQSSTEAYIYALQKGCRCIEIDCWDGADGRPVVMHGRTLTSKVLFSDCIDVIAKHAFVSSPYPLIISLEVHCNSEQQAAMTQIMKDKFGDQLLLEPIMTNTVSLPSPEELKGRILIKVKASKSVDEGAVMRDMPTPGRQRSLSTPYSQSGTSDCASSTTSPVISSSVSISPTEYSGTSYWTAQRSSFTSASGTPASLSSATEDSDLQMPAVPSKKSKKKTSNIVGVLGELGVYTQGIKYSGFRAAESRRYNHVFSFAERTFESLYRKEPDNKTSLEKHNVRYLMRVYPSGWRVLSSNFDPIRYWRSGVQMAALNWQTYDTGLQINDAMFAAGSDRTGYVLKPAEMRQSRPRAASGPENPIKSEKKLVTLFVDIISGQRFPRSRGLSTEASINPCVELEMLSADDKAQGIPVYERGRDAFDRSSVSGLGSPLRKVTQPVLRNGYNPSFDSSFKLSLESHYPSLVFVRWNVMNCPGGRNTSDRHSLATFTAKLSSLEEGYRHLPLFDANGEQYLFSTLFVRIRKQQPTVSSAPPTPTPESGGSLEPAKSSRRNILARARSQHRRTTDSSSNSTFSRTNSMN
ncbi:MAG: hypothetical protein Q9165_001992 [Trypethelium subeluteriae]